MRLSDALDLRVDPQPVAFARILLSFALGVTVLEASAVLSGIAAGKLQYPVFPALPGPTPFGVQVYLVIGLIAAACLLVGLFTGAAAATGSIALAAALLWDQQTYSSHHLLATLLLAYLAFAESGHTWGVGALRSPPGATVPWWPQALMMTQVTALYLFAALSKINPRFLSGEPLQEWMWIDWPLWMSQALAFATVATELFLAAALWIPRLRVLAVVAGVGLHAGIVIGLAEQTLVLTAFAAASMSTYGLFLHRPPLAAIFSSKPAAAKADAAPADAASRLD
ncbi:hypothetical protein D8Y24_03590 [Agrococcus lahaulensis]|nr:hypothetical protein D8Y24_03590 [Agrococcus lahaulensis]